MPSCVICRSCSRPGPAPAPSAASTSTTDREHRPNEVLLDIGPGDEVIVPANTFVATAEAVCRAGARPRFVDVLPDTLEIDPDAVAAAVRPDTAAVVAVHMFGQPADMGRLQAVTRRHGLTLIEDAAQAHGARFGAGAPAAWGSRPPSASIPGRTWAPSATAARWSPTTRR